MMRPVLTTDLRGRHTLEETFSCRDPLHEVQFVVDAGFTWDGPSIPRLLWPLLPPHYLSGGPALIHDLLYRTGGDAAGYTIPLRRYTRAEADGLFLYFMWEDGVKWWRRYAAYLAVRAFGWVSAWKGKRP